MRPRTRRAGAKRSCACRRLMSRLRTGTRPKTQCDCALANMPSCRILGSAPGSPVLALVECALGLPCSSPVQDSRIQRRLPPPSAQGDEVGAPNTYPRLRSMVMNFVIALALIVANVSAANAAPTSSCARRAAFCRVPLAAQVVPAADRLVVAALCCCKTHSRGECSVQAARCGGKPPGCFCASPSIPVTPPAKSGPPSFSPTTEISAIAE